MTDSGLKEIFSEKLGNFESTVNPSLWSGIESALPATKVAAGVVAKTIGVKLWIAAASVAVIGTVATIIAINSSEEKTAQTFPAKTENAIVQRQENTSAQTEEIKPALPSQPKDEEVKTPVQQNTFTQKEKEDFIPAPTQTTRHTTNGLGEREGDNTTTSGKQPPATNHQPPTTTNQQQATEVCNANFHVIRTREDQLRHFFIAECVDAKSYHWILGDEGESDDMSAAITFSKQGEFSITLTTTDADGKTFTEHQQVKAYLPVEFDIANIFTPNSDGNNDVFDPTVYAKNMTVENFIVVDLSNKTIFESHSTSMTWDGNDRFGNPATDGTYMVLVSGKDFSGQRVDKKAILTLKRS